MQRRFLGLMAIGHQPTQQVDHEVGHTAVARVLDLGNVLQLVGDAFNDGAFPQQDFVGKREQAVLHVGFELGDKVNAALPPSLVRRLVGRQPVS